MEDSHNTILHSDWHGTHLRVGYIGVGVLVLLAITGKSAVMAVSALGIALTLWVTRRKSMRSRMAWICTGALGGSLLAETIHTLYHLLGGVTASGDTGFFYTSAVLVGAINAVSILVLVLLTEVIKKRLFYQSS